MFHSLLRVWFDLTLKWGYAGIFGLMAIESTVFPLPSEVVIPPAAYWARQGHMNFWGVVVVGALGSWAGAALSYWVARWLGRPLILKYGKYLFVPEKKWLLAEEWINRYSVAGIFFARLLPVVRHLVSLPAGAARMPFWRFTILTVLGCVPWVFGLTFAGKQAADNWTQWKDSLHYVDYAVAAMIVAGVVYLIVRRRRRPADVPA